MNVKKLKIGFIGGGNMGEALIAGLLNQNVLRPGDIGVAEPDAARLKKLKAKYKILSRATNAELAATSEAILLAVKPQQMTSVLNEIYPHLTPRHLVLSIAAGLDASYFRDKLPSKTRFIRIMPNLCSMIGEGAAALYAAPSATGQDRTFAKKIFAASGKAVFVESEELLDTVTAVSGSGPAFVFLFIDALIQAGAARGLAAELGKELVLQTLTGATKMVEASKEPIAEMIGRVASKGGTTEAGLKVLADLDFRKLIDQTIGAAAERAAQLRKLS
ncbi:MAG TPA: pyrroline-5-carboxylate reductase [bacterium]|nr:pyrroline-5-carboxylate reductase [bacterium]